jgi:hypothetical protein
MKFFKSNDNELTLLKIKVLTSVTNQDCSEDEDPNVDYNLEFDSDSVKGITMIEVDQKGI